MTSTSMGQHPPPSSSDPPSSSPGAKLILPPKPAQIRLHSNPPQVAPEPTGPPLEPTAAASSFSASFPNPTDGAASSVVSATMSEGTAREALRALKGHQAERAQAAAQTCHEAWDNVRLADERIAEMEATTAVRQQQALVLATIVGEICAVQDRRRQLQLLSAHHRHNHQQWQEESQAVVQHGGEQTDADERKTPVAVGAATTLEQRRFLTGPTMRFARWPAEHVASSSSLLVNDDHTTSSVRPVPRERRRRQRQREMNGSHDSSSFFALLAENNDGDESATAATVPAAIASPAASLMSGRQAAGDIRRHHHHHYHHQSTKEGVEGILRDLIDDPDLDQLHLEVLANVITRHTMQQQQRPSAAPDCNRPREVVDDNDRHIDDDDDDDDAVDGVQHARGASSSSLLVSPPPLEEGRTGDNKTTSSTQRRKCTPHPNPPTEQRRFPVVAADFDEPEVPAILAAHLAADRCGSSDALTIVPSLRSIGDPLTSPTHVSQLQRSDNSESMQHERTLSDTLHHPPDEPDESARERVSTTRAKDWHQDANRVSL